MRAAMYNIENRHRAVIRPTFEHNAGVENQRDLWRYVKSHLKHLRLSPRRSRSCRCFPTGKTFVHPLKTGEPTSLWASCTVGSTVWPIYHLGHPPSCWMTCDQRVQSLYQTHDAHAPIVANVRSRFLMCEDFAYKDGRKRRSRLLRHHRPSLLPRSLASHIALSSQATAASTMQILSFLMLMALGAGMTSAAPLVETRGLFVNSRRPSISPIADTLSHTALEGVGDRMEARAVARLAAPPAAPMTTASWEGSWAVAGFLDSEATAARIRVRVQGRGTALELEASALGSVSALIPKALAPEAAEAAEAEVLAMAVAVEAPPVLAWATRDHPKVAQGSVKLRP